MAKHGLGCDNLIGVELVTADGEMLDVSDAVAPRPDVGAARRRRQLRGRGVAHATACARCAMVTGGLIAHPIDAAGDMLRFYRDAIAGCPDELTVFAGVVHAPDGSGMKLAAMIVCHTATPTAPSRPGAVQGVGLAADGRGGADALPGHEHADRRRLSRRAPSTTGCRASRPGLPDALIDTIDRALRDRALADVGDPARALPRRGDARRSRRPPPCRTARRAGTCCCRRSGWIPPTRTTNIAWTKDTLRGAVGALGRGRWLNYLGDDQGDDAIRAAYGPNYDRLRGGQAPLRPRQRLPPEPQHRPVAGHDQRSAVRVAPRFARYTIGDRARYPTGTLQTWTSRVYGHTA